MILYYILIILYHIILYYFTLHDIKLYSYYIISYHIYYTILFYIVLYGIISYRIILYYIILVYIIYFIFYYILYFILWYFDLIHHSRMKQRWCMHLLSIEFPGGPGGPPACTASWFRLRPAPPLPQGHSQSHSDTETAWALVGPWANVFTKTA